MKKFWIVLLSVALIMAFAMPVCAADVKFSGSYIVQGYYENNRALAQRDSDGSNYGPSLSNIWQRLRVQTDFQIQEGLTLTTRFDAMEKIWGAARTPVYVGTVSQAPAAGTAVNGLTGTSSNGPNLEAENIKFEHVYVTFVVPWGKWQAGYMQQTAFGTDFGNSGDSTYGPRIAYSFVTGPWTLGLIYDKYEAMKAYSSGGPALIAGAAVSSTGAVSYTYAATGPAQVDADRDKISPYFIYKWGGGEAGILFQYRLNSTNAGNTSYTSNATIDNGYKEYSYLFNPYYKARIGSVYTEGEFMYRNGKDRKYESPAPGVNDIDNQGYALYLMGQIDLAPAYVGASIVWISGTDVTKTDKNTAFADGGGADFNPCLILGNNDLSRWNGPLGGVSGGGLGTSTVTYTIPGQPTGGSVFSPGLRAGQLFGGIKPMPKLDVRASITMAKADQTLPGVDADAGKEFDLTATYKIYDNLSYMVGFGYLWSGDMFKLGGTTVNGAYNKVDNDYLVTHKLTLTF